ncbi:MAG: hypothetical protein CMA71_04425 [Euryarchaeota archaeon]|nr:hypothetical protein [Euryarchaeota archaeon]
MGLVDGDHSPTHSRWSVEIGEDGSAIESMMLTEQGTALIPVHIVNENLVSITIELNYSAPFDATISGPESITVDGSSDVRLDVIIRGVDILEFEGGSEEDFEVTGTVTSRQGLPVSVPGDTDSAQVVISMPSIKKMTLETEGPGGQIDAGEAISILVTLTNEGNVQQVPFNVQLTSNCVLMKLDIYLDGLDSRYDPKEVKSSQVSIDVPEENPTETCTLSVEAVIYPNDDLSVKITLNESTDVMVNGPTESELDIDVSGITDSLPSPSPLFVALALLSTARLRTMRQPKS